MLESDEDTPSEPAARQLAFLERIVQATAAGGDHTRLLRTIIDETTEATGTQVCSLYLWDDVEKVLVLTATNGLAARHWRSRMCAESRASNGLTTSIRNVSGRCSRCRSSRMSASLA